MREKSIRDQTPGAGKGFDGAVGRRGRKAGAWEGRGKLTGSQGRPCEEVPAKGGSLDPKEREFQKGQREQNGREVRLKEQKVLGLGDSEAFAHFGSCSSGKVAKSGQTTWVEGRQESAGGGQRGRRRGRREPPENLGRSVVCFLHDLNPFYIYTREANHRNYYKS